MATNPDTDIPVVVLGGGHLGAAVARHAAQAGHPVIVASPTPRAHAGLWCRWASESPLPAVQGARVCVAIGPPAQGEPATWGEAAPRAVLGAWRGGAAAVTLCGPAGAGEPGLDAFTRGLARLSAAPRTTVLRFGPLFGVDDHCAWQLLTELRGKGVARLPRRLPPAWPLFVEDAARAVVRTWGEGGARVLRGPTRITAEDLASTLTDRFGGRATTRLWGASPYADRLRAWGDLPDDWDDARLGARLGFGMWVEKLPGLRRRR